MKFTKGGPALDLLFFCNDLIIDRRYLEIGNLTR